LKNPSDKAFIEFCINNAQEKAPPVNVIPQESFLNSRQLPETKKMLPA